MKRFIDYDPQTRTSTWFEYDSITKDSAFATVQDVEPSLEYSKALQKEDDYTKRGVKESWMHAAHIPVVVQEHWLKHLGVDVLNKHHWPEVRKLLNSPEWKYLRTVPTGWRI